MPKPKPLPPLTEQRIARLRARLPLAVVAVRSGVPLTSLSEWERGRRNLPEDTVERIRRVIDRSLSPDEKACRRATLAAADVGS
jgi:transcriptional regulator with XRE-family HTH domain